MKPVTRVSKELCILPLLCSILLKCLLERASSVQKKYYDAHHSQRVTLKAGDRVFVLLDDHPVRSLVRGMHKLRDNKWGPFRILEMVGTGCSARVAPFLQGTSRDLHSPSAILR